MIVATLLAASSAASLATAPRLQEGTPLMVGAAVGVETPGLGSGTWPPFDLTIGFSRPQGPGRLHIEASLRVGPGARPLWRGAAPETDGAIVALVGLGYAPGGGAQEAEAQSPFW